MASTSLASLLFVVQLVTIVFGTQQEVTFYTELDEGGVGLTFRSNIPALSDYSFITNNTKSMCATGVWLMFEQTNFEEFAWIYGSIITEEKICSYYNGPIFNSVRHLGAPNTLTEALTLYEGEYVTGREHFVTTTANNLPFTPSEYVSSGRTVWTLFEGSDFDGNSTCTPEPLDNMHYGLISTERRIRSVVKGCGAEAERNIAKYKLGLE